MAKKKNNILMILVFAMALSFLSCKKDKSSCYEELLFQQHKNDICTADCPGVTGCDGNIYCNECDANRKGIQIK
ncbi:hypothetical protein BH09BAC5_BH09BAC5_11620 [soil metagenome]